ncbi:MAG TPA: hypothetical protein HPP83_05530 [Candidatus Hydrogenedentes bacterium]|nr:hypothetical protein [Candidatus Hydrogenedentota bacterium]
MVEYVKLVAVVKFFVAVSAILGGVAFLRLRSWSRYLLQALCWLWIVYAVGFSVPLLRSVPPVAFWGALDWKAGTYFMLTLVTGLLMLAGFIVPAVVIIFALRGQTVGGAMTPDSKEAAV